MSASLWNINDVKETYRVYEAIDRADPQNPAKHFYLGMTMQMVGQAEAAEKSYRVFREECCKYFMGIERAVEHHETRLRELEAQGQTVEADREAYNMSQMVDILRGPSLQEKRRRSCVLM